MEPQAETQAPAMTPEQAADLAGLMQSVSDQPPLPGQEPPPAVVVIDLGREIAGLVVLAVKLAGPIFPSLTAIYTEEVADSVGSACASVCDKYGWAQDGFMGDYGVEIGAAIVLAPLAFATVQGIKADIAENKRKADYIERRKNAVMQDTANIKYNLDGKTDPTPPGQWGQLTPQPQPEAAAVENS